MVVSKISYTGELRFPVRNINLVGDCSLREQLSALVVLVQASLGVVWLR